MGALCIQCYPKMLKTTKRGNLACYFVIFVCVIVVLTMIIIANVDESQGEADIDSAEVFDPTEAQARSLLTEFINAQTRY